MLAQRHVFAGHWIHIRRVEPKAAGLKAVVGVDQIVVLLRHEGLVLHKPGRQRLHKA